MSVRTGASRAGSEGGERDKEMERGIKREERGIKRWRRETDREG